MRQAEAEHINSINLKDLADFAHKHFCSNSQRHLNIHIYGKKHKDLMHSMDHEDFSSNGSVLTLLNGKQDVLSFKTPLKAIDSNTERR